MTAAIPRLGIRPGLSLPLVAGLLLALLLLAALNACTVARSTVGPDGRLLVLGPEPALSLRALPADWIMSDIADPRRAGLAIVERDGVRALRAATGPGFPEQGAILGRRVDVPLLATPYLRWGWQMQEVPPGEGDHPARLLLIFHGGDRAHGSRGNEVFAWTGSRLPARDRALEIVWAAQGETAGRADTQGGLGRYVARAGSAGQGRWMLETVDLSAIYGRLWPEDRMARVRLTFIGLQLAPDDRRSSAYFAEILLSK